MSSNYITRNVGRSLTETKHVLYNDLEMQCVTFYTCSQERNLDSWTAQQFFDSNVKELKEAKCGTGMRLYGIMPDRTVVKLMEIIDSSD